jgi:hypothetical protein
LLRCLLPGSLLLPCLALRRLPLGCLPLRCLALRGELLHWLLLRCLAPRRLLLHCLLSRCRHPCCPLQRQQCRRFFNRLSPARIRCFSQWVVSLAPLTPAQTVI